jgi:hypothetical protein
MISNWKTNKEINELQKKNIETAKSPESSNPQTQENEKLEINQIENNLKEMYDGVYQNEERNQENEISKIQNQLNELIESVNKELNELTSEQEKQSKILEKLFFLFLWFNMIIENWSIYLPNLVMPSNIKLTELKDILASRYFYSFCIQ